MRIISKFHDYYDGVAKSKGIDPSIVYIRKTARLPIPYEQLKKFTLNKIALPNGEQLFGILGFCGKLYPFVKTDIAVMEGPRGLYQIQHREITYTYGIAAVEEAYLKKGYGIFWRK